MKKIICSLPLQLPRKAIYSSENAAKYSYPFKTAFPVIPLIHSAAREGDTVCVCILEWLSNGELSAMQQNNLLLLKEEIDSLAVHAGFNVNYTEIKLADEQTKKEHLHLFQSLIQQFENGDSLYADITYGTKPTPIIIFSALNYAFKTKKDCNIAEILYARYHYDTDTAFLYDISSVFYLSNIIDRLSENGSADSEKIVNFLLDITR